MEKNDLEKLIRIAASAGEIVQMAVKLQVNDNRVRGGMDYYRNSYQVVDPIIGRNTDYLSEFRILPNLQQVSFSNITTSLVAFKAFLDGIIKQETLSSQTAIEGIKNEYFIDENKPFSAYKAVSAITTKATSSLKMVDNYIEATSLDFFSGVNSKAQIDILTTQLKPNAAGFKIALSKFQNEWGGSIQIKISNYFHDRYIILDNLEVWHLGPSLNHLGVKPAMISQIQDAEIAKHILALFDTQWKSASII